MHDHAFAALQTFVRRHPRLFVLTGAGVSTASGIPGYRDEAGAWKRRAPITVQEFRSSDAMRRRYWARSMVGWPIVERARPSAAHRALAAFAATGCVEALVTQNVDGLHQRAGSTRVIELHGNLERVACLACGALHSRAAVQEALVAINPSFAELTAAAAPDGDADLDAVDLESFRIPGCATCSGVLKPDVVFFGENVPVERVRAAFDALDRADAMLVVGSSLMVWSGFRFCDHASRTGKPIAAINAGRTRADALFALKVERDCGEALTALSAGFASVTPLQ
jgi:NAD-dependent SIR2 family protein deacetylase